MLYLDGVFFRATGSVVLMIVGAASFMSSAAVSVLGSGFGISRISLTVLRSGAKIRYFFF